MPEAAPDAEFLNGKQVVVTGRLASMTRAEAATLIRAHGGFFRVTVTRRTSLLIVGQDGWPLQRDGRLTTKLRRARSLQRAGHRVAIVPEEELLGRLGLEEHAEGVRRRYSAAQLSRLLKVPGDRLRHWVKAGLIHPVDIVHGISHFDYSQAAGARTLCQLSQAGVKPARIRQSLQQLSQWLGNVEQPLNQLAALENSGELLVRLEDGLAEPTGQRHFDFAEPTPQATVSIPEDTGTAEEWFEKGCEREDAGHLTEAAEAYRHALLLGGLDRDSCFNLANVLHRLGQEEQAAERFYQVVEMDCRFAEAWNNLGVVLSELRRPKEALAAFRQALGLQPDHAEANYNLADFLEDTGCRDQAGPHWQAYLRQDPHSRWGRYARARLQCST